jgi:hypothetical protein
MSVALNGTNGVTYNDGTVQASAPVGRNLIINGNMRIAQRGTSVTGLTGTAYSTVDRFQTVISSLGTWTESQSTDAPAGFSSSLKFECTTANASPAAGSVILTNHRIEGNTLPSLAFGTASAKSVTLSFWVKSNKIGTYAVGFRNIDNGRAIGGNYTIDSADTWEQKTFTFEGDTVSGFNIDNTVAATVEWFFGAGTDYTSGTMPTTWATTVTANRAAGQTVNLADSTSNYINITGVQLETGTTATDFEHLQYGQQLALCQRYAVVLANSTSGKSGITMLGTRGYIGFGLAHNSVNPVVYCELPIIMRALPSQTYSSVSHFMFDRGWAATATLTALSIQSLRSSTKSIALIGTTSGLNNGDAGAFDFNNTAGWLLLDAEL